MLRQASETGQLYGSVSARDLATLIGEGGFTVNRNQIQLDAPLKVIGMHTVAPVFSTFAATPFNDSVYWLALDNIFTNSSNTAILGDMAGRAALRTRFYCELLHGVVSHPEVAARHHPDLLS